MCSVIILAGGTGSRMHQSVPKQFLALAGKPMLLHTLERLEKIDQVEEIVIVCHPQYQELLQMNIAAYMLKKSYVVVDGGKTRQESVYYGLMAASGENVLIHEAARPFVKTEEFLALIQDGADCATYGIEIPFTVSLFDGEMLTGLLERDKLLNVQLPQKFLRAELLCAHEQARQEGKLFTEDTSLLYHYRGAAIKILPGTSNNIKITNYIDLLAGEAIYKEYIVGRD